MHAHDYSQALLCNQGTETPLPCRELTLANAWLVVCSLLHMALSVTLVKCLGTTGGASGACKAG